MGRGSSKAAGGKMAAPKGVTKVTVGDENIDLTGIPLVYGDNDPNVAGNARKAIEDWENKRIKNKIEYNMSVDQDGNPLHDEVKGGKKSVRVPSSGLQAGAIHTHIHPREGGILGGTFSEGDMRNFANNDLPTYRAKAKEGAYSISKNNNFDKQGFKSYISDINSKYETNISSRCKAINDKMRTDKSYTYDQYSKDFDKAINSCLIDLHNDMLAGQKKYGYYYTLEGGNQK